MTKKADAKITSVALQHRSGSGVTKYAKLNPTQLHQQTLSAREALYGKCVDATNYTYDVVLPYCEEIIARYKMPGVGTKDRPNGKPTVEAYFKSIRLHYSTVRSWIHRKNKKLSVAEIFNPEKTDSKDKSGKVPTITQFEALLLGTASAGHYLANAIRQGRNLDDAVRDFEDHALTPERIDKYIQRPVKVATTEVEKMAVRLCKLIDKNDDKDGQKILALARELLTKAEPTTVQQVLDDERKPPQREESREAIASRMA
jgi:hypothetical protein